jgi:general nucleoside transport system permease protein
MDITTIPVIGVLVQLVLYLIEVLPEIAPITIALAAPIALGAMCGVIGERSGVVNIGIEGTMLIAAFVGFLVAGLVAQAFPVEASGSVFGATPALLLGLVAAVLSAMAVSALHAWLSISVRTDQIISGTIINIAAIGLTGYFNRLWLAPNPRLGAGTFQSYSPPEELTGLPVVGWMLDALLSQGPIAMSVIVIVVVLQILLFRSRWGLRTRSVGENPAAADTVGINVFKLRYRNVILAGAFAGLAGAYLTLEATGSFQNGMTTGRGFIALAAVIFGRWTPLGAWGAALLFSFTDALSVAIGLDPPTGTLGEILNAIPAEFYASLPYVVTIIVLAGVVGRSVAPAAVGRPYTKESQT